MELERRVAVTSAVIYTAVSLIISLLFYSTATLVGTNTAVARFGGGLRDHFRRQGHCC